ncbi:hypothetical protein AB0G35_20715 [Streptomyces sp. NPDC021749]|uniref:hypothetical protein n=1 Tax=Streptomyces sp. NPDC021749 TaxID=3154905 RepID=UPI0033FD62BC
MHTTRPSPSPSLTPHQAPHRHPFPPLPTLLSLSAADFRDRVRRPAYAVVLAAAVALGYLAVPDSDAHWVIMQIGDHRGIYNSAYVGMATALAAGLWLSLGGFYLVRDALDRDRTTRVGQLLAATPLRTSTYLAGKFLSNLMVLSSLLAVLALTALIMQLTRGESATPDLLALWQPFVLIALPLLAVTAALALLFEALPLLRTGLGNVVWFCVWLVLATAGQGPGLPFDGIGVHSVARSMHAEMVAQHLPVNGEFSLGLTYLDQPLRLFTWHGFTPTAGYLLGRTLLLLLACALAVLPALWLPRYTPARTTTRTTRNTTTQTTSSTITPTTRRTTAQTTRRTTAQVTTRTTAPRPDTSRRARTAPSLPLPLWSGELRILLQGVRWWWWLGAALLLGGGLCSSTVHGATRVMLPLAWIWPVLIWSRLGTQQHESGVHGMLGAYPAARRRLLAEWAAGLTLTAATGLGSLIRLLAAADWSAVTSWLAGALFVPSLALALGTLSRTHRLFQAVYLPLWYTVANGLPVFDYMGALHAPDQAPTLTQPLLTLAATAALLATTFTTTTLRRTPPN